ncbi:MAG: hypothetical protein LBS55_05415 [Prevotellaceae bacterium]|jgi:hypothetical protein|nr:hypothetical protein [Prevotellaceae bacterium]
MAKSVSNVLHRIKAFLYDNVLTKDKPHDYIARVSSERSLGVREICESAVMRGGADVSVATIISHPPRHRSLPAIRHMPRRFSTR